jgi:hypothetical protein
MLIKRLLFAVTLSALPVASAQPLRFGAMEMVVRDTPADASESLCGILKSIVRSAVASLPERIPGVAAIERVKVSAGRTVASWIASVDRAQTAVNRRAHRLAVKIDASLDCGWLHDSVTEFVRCARPVWPLLASGDAGADPTHDVE